MLSKQYIAGFIDGEGWIGVLWKKRYLPHYGQDQFIGGIGITNTHKEPLIAISKQYGGRIRVSKTRGNRKTKYILEIFKKAEQIKLLEDILPYLVIKKEHAKTILEFYSPKRKWYKIPKEEQQRRHKLWKKMKYLNWVGKGKPPTSLLENGSDWIRDKESFNEKYRKEKEGEDGRG